jgi:hypothetical protein
MRLRLRERERRRHERVFEIRRVDAAPLEEQLAHEHAFELRRKMIHALI